MAYSVTRADGTRLVTVEDGSKNQQYSVSFVGKGLAAYGTMLNDNFLRLLENSASSTAPLSPVLGQLWYDTTNNLLKICKDENPTLWVAVGSSIEAVISLGNVSTAAVIDRALGNIFNITATGNFAVAINNITAGQTLTIFVTQDSAGNRIWTYPSTFRFLGGVNTLSTAASAIDKINILFDGTYYFTDITKGFTAVTPPSLGTITTTATGNNGAMTIVVASTAGLALGQGVTGTCIGAGAVITGIDTQTRTVTLSVANTCAVTGSVIFTPAVTTTTTTTSATTTTAAPTTTTTTTAAPTTTTTPATTTTTTTTTPAPLVPAVTLSVSPASPITAGTTSSITVSGTNLGSRSIDLRIVDLNNQPIYQSYRSSGASALLTLGTGIYSITARAIDVGTLVYAGNTATATLVVNAVTTTTTTTTAAPSPTQEQTFNWLSGRTFNLSHTGLVNIGFDFLENGYIQIIGWKQNSSYATLTGPGAVDLTVAEYKQWYIGLLSRPGTQGRYYVKFIDRGLPGTFGTFNMPTNGVWVAINDSVLSGPAFVDRELINGGTIREIRTDHYVNVVAGSTFGTSSSIKFDIEFGQEVGTQDGLDIRTTHTISNITLSCSVSATTTTTTAAPAPVINSLTYTPSTILANGSATSTIAWSTTGAITVGLTVDGGNEETVGASGSLVVGPYLPAGVGSARLTAYGFSSTSSQTAYLTVNAVSTTTTTTTTSATTTTTAAPGAPVAPLGFNGTRYYWSKSTPGSSSMTLRFQSNGTWSIIKASAGQQPYFAINDGPASWSDSITGNWYAPTTTNVGTGYLIKFTSNDYIFSNNGSTTLSGGDSGWLVLNQDRTQQVSITSTSEDSIYVAWRVEIAVNNNGSPGTVVSNSVVEFEGYHT
jgi:hypothetical protein